MSKLRLGVLLSGSGSNLQAIMDAIDAGQLNAEIVTVISNKADAYGLERARKAGLRAVHIDPLTAEPLEIPAKSGVLQKTLHSDPSRDQEDGAREDCRCNIPRRASQEVSPALESVGSADNRTPAQLYNIAIRDEVLDQGVDYVVMAGYMKLLGTEVLDAFPNRVLNLHPALLPSFPGAHGIADALAYGVKVTGITVHFANEEFDKGPIIAQTAVPVLEGDTEESLATRIHAAEHELYPRVLQQLAEGEIHG